MCRQGAALVQRPQAAAVAIGRSARNLFPPGAVSIGGKTRASFPAGKKRRRLRIFEKVMLVKNAARLHALLSLVMMYHGMTAPARPAMRQQLLRET